MRRTLLLLALAGAGSLAAAGCGSSGSPSSSSTSPPATQADTATGSSAPGALVGEAGSAAAGDIPDNQTFLVFSDHAHGFSMRYPEGWATRRTADGITFRDKNNVVRVAVGQGSAPTAATLRRSLGQVARVGSVSTVSLPGGRALALTYRTVSRRNAVTGRRVTLTVDRYAIPGSGRTAIVDLGTPVGVDNVDAYRLMVRSFRWR
jgi:hypothetical protein